MSAEHFEPWRKGDPVQYIRPEIPAFEAPKYAGARYTATVPDTLDLAERAELAVNGLTGPTDPDADYEIYWRVSLANHPPMMQHDGNDHVQVKFMEALPLMRLISGSDENRAVDRRWMEVLLHMQGPDGSLYFPVQGRPWCHIDTYGGPPGGEHYTRPYDDGRLLGAMSIYYLLTGDRVWGETGEKVVQGLVDRAVDKGEYAYFAATRYDVGAGNDPSAPMPEGGTASCAGWALHGLSQFYRTTGCEPARRLATKLARGLRDHARWYHPDGRWILENPHFHHHSLPLLAICDHAVTTGDTDLLEFARKGYEFGRTCGAPRLGFFPEAIVTDYEYAAQWGNTSELCEVADMIALGLKLTLSGIRDYWDDVDRWTRNQFAEGQLCRCDWIDRLGRDGPVSAVDTRYQTTERVAERNLGAFATFPWPNDWYRPEWGWGISHCCTGNAARTLYMVWKNVLTRDGPDKLRVNLLLNRASRWADVDSHVPYTGRVDVKIKEPVDLSIRIPEWVEPNQVSIAVNTSPRDCRFDGRYAQVGAVKPDDQVTMAFPIEERAEEVFIERKRYTVVRRGNDVVWIDPPGRYHPLYQRAHYRQDRTRWHEVSRFVCDKDLAW